VKVFDDIHPLQSAGHSPYLYARPGVTAKDHDGYPASKLRVEACMLKTFEEAAKTDN
jgi:hypothetical protein